MTRARLLSLAGLALATFGSLAYTGGYALYLRSDAHRNFCASRLSAYLDLPAEIAAVVPRSRRAMEFRGVRVWLPGRRVQVASCESAMLVYTPGRDDPGAYEIHLRGGVSEVSTRTWLRSDYGRVLTSGLGPGFDPTGPRRVVLSDVSVALEHEQFRARLDGAGGVITFKPPSEGRATVLCNALNGHRVAAQVLLHAQFSPGVEGIQLDRVELIVPDIPLASLGVAVLAGPGARAGVFNGRSVYERGHAGGEWLISGRLRDAALAELTRPGAPWLPVPWRGTASDIEFDELRLVGGYPVRMRFHGALTDVVLGDVLTPLGLRDVGGELELRVHEAEITWAGVERLVASGRCRGLALDRLAEAFGGGRMTGEGQLDLIDLTIVGNRLASCDVELRAEPAEHTPPWIERRLLSSILQRTLGVGLPSFLPERFEYRVLGLRLEIREEFLHVFGTHGPRNRTILTVAWGGQELPVVVEPREGFDLQPMLSQLRQRFAQEALLRLRSLDPRLVARITAATSPATGVDETPAVPAATAPAPSRSQLGKSPRKRR